MHGDGLSEDEFVLQETELVVGPHIESGVAGLLQHTVLVDVVQADGRVLVLSTLGEREVVVTHEGGAVDFLLPVGVGRLQVDAFDGIVVVGGEDRVRAGTEDLGLRRLAVSVLVRLPVHVAPLVGIHEVQILGIGLGGEGGVEVDADLAGFRPLGRDDDDAGGSLRTVDGGGGGVLQDLDRLDVMGRHQGVDAGVHDHTVHDIQRSRGVDGGRTADPGGSTLRTRSTVDAHVHTGDAALEGGEYVRGRDLGYLLHVDDADRAGEVGLLFRHVTGHDDVIQEFGGFVQDDVDDRPAVDVFFNGHISDRRKLEDGIPCDVHKGILAIEVGDCTSGRPLDDHAGPDEGLPVVVNDRTADITLGVGAQRHGCRYNEEQGTF